MQDLHGNGGRPPGTLTLVSGRVVATRLLASSWGDQTWLGTDHETARPVVIRTLQAPLVPAEVWERLPREIDALRSVQRPECIPFRWIERDQETVYLIRDHAPGRSLRACLKQGPLSVPEALEVARGVLHALREAHTRGVLHRSISPSHVFLEAQPGGRPRVALTDFSLSPTERVAFSLRNVPLDEVRYLSPELAGLLERGLEAASDLYSLGLVLFEALSGRHPFSGEEPGEILRQQLTAQAPDMRSTGVRVPRALAGLVERLLRKDPRDRYQSAEGVLADIEALLEALERGDADPDFPLGRRDTRRTLSDPSFVGRQSELRVLEAAAERALHGHAGLVLVEGESGGGKSRLLTEFADRSARVRAAVFRGQGIDQGAQRPFQMFFGVAQRLVEMAREAPHFTSALGERLGDARHAVAEALPELASLFGERQGVSLGPEDLGETRSLRAGAALLDALGTPERPVIVLLDDCQWADDQSLKLLRYWHQLVQDNPASPRHVLVVAAFRAEEVPENHPVRMLQPAAHLRLSGFNPEELTLLLESMAGSLPPQVVELTRRLSEGNPFIASAVLQGLLDSGALKPGPAGWLVDEAALAQAQTSRQAALFLVRRIRQLPAATLKLLSVAAVLGKHFDLDTAALLAGVTQIQAAAALEEASRRRILWLEGTPGRYAFVHDKLREATLAVLGEEARRPLHHKAASILEERTATGAFDIAFHYDAAGESARALPYALVAAEEARRRHALEIAERYYRIAERGSRESDAATRLRVVLGLGDILTLRGGYEEASTWYDQARGLARDELTSAEVEGKIGELAFKKFDHPTALEACRRGLQRLGRYVPRSGFMFFLLLLWELTVYTLRSAFPFLRPRTKPLGTPQARAALLAVSLYDRLLYLFFFATAGKVPAGWATLASANLAEKYPPTVELGHVYSVLANVIAAGFPPLVSWAYVLRERALAIHRKLGNLHGEGQALAYHWAVSAPRGEWEDGIRRAQEGRKLLALTGDQWDMNAAGWGICFSRYHQGDLAGTVEEARRLYEAARRIGDVQYMGNALWLWAQGSGGRVPAELIESALARPHLFLTTRISLLGAKGLRLIAEGKPEQAAQLLAEARGLALRGAMMDSLICPIVAWEATALRLAAERTRPMEVSRRRALLDRAATAARRARWIGAIFKVDRTRALRESGLIATLRGRGRQARRFFDRGIAWAERHAGAHERALTLEARGEAGRALGWPEAEADAALAQRLLNELGGDSSSMLSKDKPRATLSLVERFSTVLDKGRALATSLTREAVFSAIQDAARTLLRGETCVVLEVAREDGGPALRPLGGGEALECSLLARRAWASRALTVFNADAPVEKDDMLVLAGIKSALAAPVLVGGEVAAVFCVTHRHVAGLFGEDEERLAGFISTLAGAALENTEGFAKVEEALRLRDEFLSVASHELKTPLTPLSLKLQTLARVVEAEPDSPLIRSMTRHIEVMRRQVKRLSDLVGDLLDVSRIRAGHLSLSLEEVDLSAVARDVASQFEGQAHKANCPIEVRAEGPVRGTWDKAGLEQIVTNLLSNAIKYGAGKPILLEVRQEAGRAKLLVRDEGIGIAPEAMGRIFGRFERAVSERHYGGLGLGLYISRRIVEALGGGIGVQSTLGQGTTFTVELPL